MRRDLAAAVTTIEAIPSLNSVCRDRVGKSVGSMKSTREWGFEVSNMSRDHMGMIRGIRYGHGCPYDLIAIRIAVRPRDEDLHNCGKFERRWRN